MGDPVVFCKQPDVRSDPIESNRTTPRHATPSDPLLPGEVVVASVCVECQAVQTASAEKLPAVLAALGRSSKDPHDACNQRIAQLEQDNERFQRRLDRAYRRTG